ncbi:MAG: response regulator [Bacteroidota bacterium]
MLSKYKFLFIDDSDLDNNYIKILIDVEELPIEAHFCNSAIAALDYLKDQSAASFPEIIIVDINMPLMNGFEFTEEYQEKYAADFPDTYLFISSSTRRISEIEKSKQMDIVTDFIAKPVAADYLVNKIFPMLPVRENS